MTVKEQLEEHPEYNNMYQIMRIFVALAASRTTDLFGESRILTAVKVCRMLPMTARKIFIMPFSQSLMKQSAF